MWKFPESLADIKPSLNDPIYRQDSLDVTANNDVGLGDGDTRLAQYFIRQFAAREERLRSACIVDDMKIQISTSKKCWTARLDEISLGHSLNIFGVAFLPENPLSSDFSISDHIATGGLDKQVHIYDISSGSAL